MNKAELINAAAEKAGLSKKDTETAINAAIEVISDCLAEGDKVAVLARTDHDDTAETALPEAPEAGEEPTEEEIARLAAAEQAEAGAEAAAPEADEDGGEA